MSIKSTIRRWWLKLYTKMVGEKATPEYIARGWAIGMFYGCMIPFGFQLMLSIPTSFALKGSKILTANKAKSAVIADALALGAVFAAVFAYLGTA